jgi:hypothetical protein
MPCDPKPLERPGEDTLDLPESVGWLVAACTWLRGVVGGGPGTGYRGRSRLSTPSLSP